MERLKYRWLEPGEWTKETSDMSAEEYYKSSLGSTPRELVENIKKIDENLRKVQESMRKDR